MCQLKDLDNKHIAILNDKPDKFKNLSGLLQRNKLGLRCVRRTSVRLYDKLE